MTVAGMCSAQAADLAARPYYTKAAPPPMIAAVYDWSGLYVGLNGGYGTSRNCWSVDDPIPSGCHDATGGTFGGQIGYRWQAANWVFGLEGQGNWADFSGSNPTTYDVRLGVPLYTNHTKIQSFGLITGQVGYTFNNVLVYAKGGVAVVDNRFDYIRASDGYVASVSETRWNPTVGAGVEIGFAPNWSIGAEYNHIFQSTKDLTLQNCAYDRGYKCGYATEGLHVRQDVDLALVRLNYKFGGPIMAKY